MRPAVLVLAAVIALPSVVNGQSNRGYVFPNAPARPDPPPHFTIAPRGSLLPRTDVPLPQHGLRPWPRPPVQVQPFGDIGYFPWPMMVFYVPQSVVAVQGSGGVFASLAAKTPPDPISQPQRPAPGRLVLDLAPATAHVYVDGYYAGTPDDFAAVRGGGFVEAGPHRLDISADGHEPVVVDLMVTAGRPVTYRASLKALPPQSKVPPTTFYLIPGCYMGNIPPKDANLPATCDQSRARTWHP